MLQTYFPKRGEEDLRGIEWRYLWQASRGNELQTLAHPEIVSCVVFSPDAKLLATGCFDRKVRIWDLASKEILVQFDGLEQNDMMKYLAFSPDGKLFASGRQGGVDLRETDHWQVVRRLEGGAWPVAFSPDGMLLAVAVEGGIKLWNTLTWESIILPSGFSSGFANTLAFSPDNKRIAATARGTAPIQVWDIPSRSKIGQLNGLREKLSLAISPQGLWLAAGDRYGTAAVWNLETGNLAAKNKVHIGAVLGLAFSPDGQKLATSAEDQLIHFWGSPADPGGGCFQQRLSTLCPRKSASCRVCLISLKKTSISHG